MKFIKPGYEILKSDNFFIHTEKIGRVCYKSEDKITDDSSVKFVNMLVKRKHWAMLEHYYFVYQVYETTMHHFKMSDSHFTKFINYSSNHNIMSFSLTTILNLVAEEERCNNGDLNEHLILLINEIVTDYPELSIHFKRYVVGKSNVFTRFTDKDIQEKLSNDTWYKHIYPSVKFICDRGISHEFVRHRNSFAQESSRYCNYSQEKFDNEINIIDIASGFNIDLEEYEFTSVKARHHIWKMAMGTAESAYKYMIKFGAKPQEARSVLPNSLKTEVVMTANLEQWKHFFKMRVDPAAHPQAREVACLVYDEFVSKGLLAF